jgi:hypothetical protein
LVAPLPWVDIVKWELRNDLIIDGIAEHDVGTLIDLILRIWLYYEKIVTHPDFDEASERNEISRQLADSRSNIPGSDRVLSEELEPFDAEEDISFVARLTYDLTPYLRSPDIPIYYTFAADDINIPALETVAAIETLNQSSARRSATPYIGTAPTAL